ncbi:MAG TPA: ferredoxin--nitrite reductase, partial [Nitrospiria bacterium]|nr:ferredoxin--nitrite reductase [Nitrospiria bacterium]
SMGRTLSRRGRDERNPKKKTDHVGVFRQKQAGLNYVGLSVPVGRLSSEQFMEAGRLAETYGNGEIRLTGGQNLIIPNVPDQRLGSLLHDEPLLSRLSWKPSEVMRGLVSCTGSEYCGLALIETKDRSLKLARKLEKKVSGPKPLEIHWSGCPAACGNHLLSDIGFLGKRIKRKGEDGRSEVVEAVDIYVGGRGGVQSQAGKKVLEDVPCEELEDMLPGLVRYVSRDKGVRAVKGEAVSLETFAHLRPDPEGSREFLES